MIVIAANDPNAVCPSLNQARQAGIKVVAFDSDASKDCRDVFINQATTQGIGENLVKMASELVGGEGEIAILSATPNATNQNAWIEVMKTELAKPENAEAQAGQDRLRQRRRPEVVPGGAGPAAVVPEPEGDRLADHRGHRRGRRATSARPNYKGKVAITGLGLPNQMREYVKDGTVKKFALWDPADIGYLAGVHRRGAGLRADHRRGGREVQGRQAR